MSKLPSLLLILALACAASAEDLISFNTVFLDSTGKISFTYPTALHNPKALHELQRNFIKQKFGEKYLGQEPAAALSHYKSQNEGLDRLSDAVSFPMPGIVQYVSSYYVIPAGSTQGVQGSNSGIYTIADGKKIELSSIFNRNWEKDIVKLIVKEFLLSQNLHILANYAHTQKESDFTPEQVKISEYGGLDFVYPSNKIAPYSAGEQTIFLSWNTLKLYLNKRSAIYKRLQF